MKNISELVQDHLKLNKMSAKDLVVHMGYKNIPKGLRRLDACMKSGDCMETFRTKLAEALTMTPAEIQQAANLLRHKISRDKRETEKRAFKPHIKIVHARRRPTNITAVAFFGIERFKEIPVTESHTYLSLWEQIEMVRDVIQSHYENANGSCHLFGAITGYRYFYKFDEWVAFSINGDIMNYESGLCKNPAVVLKIGNRKISHGVFR